jgi:hypothetical protein
MAKKSGNFNVPVEPSVAEEFDDWHCKVQPGNKGQKLTGALKAIQAIHAIDEGLAFKLMKADIPIETAKKLIVDTIVSQTAQDFLDSLGPSEKAKVLLGAKAHKDRPARKR